MLEDGLSMVFTCANYKMNNGWIWLDMVGSSWVKMVQPILCVEYLASGLQTRPLNWVADNKASETCFGCSQQAWCYPHVQLSDWWDLNGSKWHEKRHEACNVLLHRSTMLKRHEEAPLHQIVYLEFCSNKALRTKHHRDLCLHICLPWPTK